MSGTTGHVTPDRPCYVYRSAAPAALVVHRRTDQAVHVAWLGRRPNELITVIVPAPMGPLTDRTSERMSYNGFIGGHGVDNRGAKAFYD